MDSCMSCSGLCCRNYFVPLTCSDLRRLVSAGHEPSDFLDWIPVGSLDSTYPDVRLSDGYYYMVLGRRGDGACVFSVGCDGSLRCGVHGSHPIVCRLYPFDELSGGFKRKAACAVRREPDFDVPGLGAQRRLEWGEYSSKVRAWNGRRVEARGREDFVRYVLSDNPP